MFSFRTTSLEDQLDKALLDGRVACFCTQNCWDTARGRYMYEIFRERGNLAMLFMPRDAELTPGTNHIDMEPEQLDNIDAVVVEIQDVGVRYFNYTKDVFKLMSIMKERENPPALYIVDHINPAGRVVEGSMVSGDSEHYVPKIAHRHGLTIGELCSLYYSETGANYPLHIISALASDSTRKIMPWTIAPASDISGLFTCYMYSGGGLWNNTGITPAIGTSRPYEYIGAPFLKGNQLDALPVPSGVMMRPCTFTPSIGKYEGERCYGYQIMLEPGVEYHSLLHTLQLVRFFSERYSQFEIYDGFYLKLADPVMKSYIEGEISFRDLQEHVKVEEQKWIRKAKRFSLYDDMPYRMK